MLSRLQQAIVPPRMIMSVVAVNTDGTVTVSTGDGGAVRALGSNAIGTKVYVQDGIVIGVAPDLTHYDIEV